MPSLTIILSTIRSSVFKFPMTHVTFDCFLWFKKSQDPDKIHTLWLVDVFYIFLNL